MSAYHELAGTYDDRFHGGYRERIQDGVISRVLNELLLNGYNKILDRARAASIHFPLLKWVTA